MGLHDCLPCVLDSRLLAHYARFHGVVDSYIASATLAPRGAREQITGINGQKITSPEGLAKYYKELPVNTKVI
jgi:hypothetical protein